MQVKQHSRLGWIVCIALVCVGGCGARAARSSESEVVPAVDATRGVALEGYDAVAYFVDHRPIRGSDAYTRTWNGVVWKFASAEHRDLFAADPTHYAPQYGGYCAYAVANRTTAHGSPKQWAVVNDRLFLNNNATAKQLWDQDRTGNIHAADQNWPQIPKRERSVDSRDGGRPLAPSL
jgi:YHS domain-containing protein